MKTRDEVIAIFVEQNTDVTEDTQRCSDIRCAGITCNECVWSVFQYTTDRPSLEDLRDEYHSRALPPPEEPMKDDVVRNPSRYELFTGVESIGVIARSFTEAEFRGFCLGNVMKYRFRAGKKDAVEQDLAKADFYVELFEKHRGLCRAE